MTTINKLSSIETPSEESLLAVFDDSEGMTYKMSFAALLEYIRDNIEIPSEYVTQTVQVPASGTTITVQDIGRWIWLFVNQGGNYATQTIVLPSSPVDGQELLICHDHTVTTLTIDGNGHSVITAITGITFIYLMQTFKYDEGTDCWYNY